MYANDPAGGCEKHTGPQMAQENDPRVTRFGKFLRKTRLDELPQLWNIIKGEMAFVGPRAERPEFHEKLKEHIPFYQERYLIKPGLSGWAQIKHGYSSSIKDNFEKVQHDLYYVKNRSFLLDLSVILKTINIILRGGGR
jgi:lipopolysaccharide/colanic/teichoic acid biosynthesis glycosyltransferase